MATVTGLVCHEARFPTAKLQVKETKMEAAIKMEVYYRFLAAKAAKAWRYYRDLIL